MAFARRCGLPCIAVQRGVVGRQMECLECNSILLFMLFNTAHDFMNSLGPRGTMIGAFRASHPGLAQTAVTCERLTCQVILLRSNVIASGTVKGAF